MTRFRNYVTLFLHLKKEKKNMEIRKLIDRLLGRTKKENSPKDFEWESFQKVAREQFVKLKEKGLSIPVVTL